MSKEMRILHIFFIIDNVSIWKKYEAAHYKTLYCHSLNRNSFFLVKKVQPLKRLKIRVKLNTIKRIKKNFYSS